MILSGAHKPGSSVFLLVFEGRPPVSVIQEVESIINDLGLNARVEYPRAVISVKEGVRLLFRLIGADGGSMDAEYSRIDVEFKRIQHFNAGAVKDYLEMITGDEWEIAGVLIREEGITARFERVGGGE